MSVWVLAHSGFAKKLSALNVYVKKREGKIYITDFLI